MGFSLGTLAPFQLEWFGVWWAAVCFVAIASLLVFLLVAIWVYRDAESRGMNGAMWLLLLIVVGFLLPFIGGIIVLVIYLTVRGEHPYGYGAYGYPPGAYPPQYPPSPVPPTAPPPPAPTNCKNCGAPLRPGGAFCPNCGSKV